MAVLGSAVALVGVLCLLDLVLTFGVIRRLREHTRLLAQAGPGRPPELLDPGASIGEFEAATIEGETLSLAALKLETVVGFFSPTCKPCRELLPGFVDRAAGLRREQVLAVILGNGDVD